MGGLAMPSKPLRACSVPGCPEKATVGSRCPRHAQQARREYDRGRPSAAARDYGLRWRRIRAAYLKAHPLCVDCGAPATDVDHEIPRSRGGTDQWSNLRGRCHSCHSRKTASQDGGWGRGVAIAGPKDR